MAEMAEEISEEEMSEEQTEPAPNVDVDVDAITVERFKEILVGKPSAALQEDTSILKRRPSDIAKLDEKDLFLQCIRDIANELDVNVLCFKILSSVLLLTQADRASLFLSRGSENERYLVSKLFNVTRTSSIVDAIHEENMIVVPFGKGIVGTVALNKETINIVDAYQDTRFNVEVDKKTGYHTTSLLTTPVLNAEGDVIGVAQIMNKSDGTQAFTEHDETIFNDFLIFCGIGLTNAQLFEMSVNEYRHNQLLLNLARGIFLEQTNLEKMVNIMLLELVNMIQCERCFIYLTSTDDSMPRIAVAYQLDSANCDKVVCPSNIYFEKAWLAKLAQDVADKQEKRNISMIGNPEYDGKPVIDIDGFTIHNVLTVPVINYEKIVVGIVQMVNKSHNTFSLLDMNSVETFAIYCGHGIHNSQVYQNVMQLMAKQKVHLEVLSFHVVASPDETRILADATIPEADTYKLYTWEFADFGMDDFETAKVAVRMLIEMNVMERFSIPYNVLCCWVLSVKKNYRPVLYHNWRHGLNVSQSMFAMLFTGNLRSLLSDIEQFALIVACMCHDLDHRGTTNTFQAELEHPLAVLYTASPLEHHHFDQCVLILNSMGNNNIFSALSSEDYKQILRLIENAILATDLAIFFKKIAEFERLIKLRNADWRSPGPRSCLRDMMMTACDLAAICKPWRIQVRVARFVAMEFFEQGDLERQQLGHKPTNALMDRERQDDLPKMQVTFIDTICMPLFKDFSRLEGKLTPLYDGCKANRENWAAMSTKTWNDIYQILINEAAAEEANAAAAAAERADAKDVIIAKIEETDKSQLSKKRKSRRDCCCIMCVLL